MPATSTHFAEEVAETNAFPTREIAEADETTEVDKGAVDIPPVACRSPRSGTMSGEQHKRHEGLRGYQQDRARGYEEQRADPRDVPARHALTDLRKRVQRDGSAGCDFACGGDEGYPNEDGSTGQR